jgi:hypothetical protein
VLKLFKYWSRREERERTMERVSLRYIVKIYVNITVSPLYNYYMLIKMNSNALSIFDRLNKLK